MYLSFVYVFLALWPLSITTSSTVYPYIVFLNPSASVPPKPINRTIQHRAIIQNASDISNVTHDVYGKQAPEVYAIGNFRWYVDHMDDEEAEILNMRDEISHMHKDNPVFYISEQVQSNLPSWASL